MNYKDWHQEAIALHQDGMSGRKISKQIGKAKSSVNDVLKAYREGTLETSEPELKKPNIIFWDLEASLMSALTFGIWDTSIPASRITKHSHILSNSYAFNDGEVQGIRLTPEQVRDGDDLDVVIDTIRAIEKADLMVTFNGNRYDKKLLNTRALFHNLPPVRYPAHCDLMQLAKRQFKFPSNSMENISVYLGQDGKLATSGSRLWERCFNWEDYEECDKALEQMLTYGKRDIIPTRELYKRFMGWSKNSPNIGLITKEINGVNTKDNHDLLCPHCSSKDVDKIGSKAYTSVSSFNIYRCGNSGCRGLSRDNAAGTKLVNYIG